MRATISPMSTDIEHDAANAQGVHGRFRRPMPDCFGRVELIQFDALTVGRAQHRQGGADVIEADELAYQRPFYCGFAFERESKFDEESFHGFEVLDDD